MIKSALISALLLSLFAASLPADEALVETANPEEFSFANRVLGITETFDLAPLPGQEQAYLGDRLNEILEAYNEGRFIRMQSLLAELFMKDPRARRVELPRMLEAESYFFNGRLGAGLRVRFSKPVYRDLLSMFPHSPRNPEKLFRYSQMLYLQGYFPEALGYFRLMEETYPKSPFRIKSRLMTGQILYETGRVLESAGDYQTVLSEPVSKEEEKALATIGLALCRVELGDAAEAERLFAGVVRYEKDRPMLNESAFFGYGKMYQMVENYPLALEVFTEFLRRYRESDLRPAALYRISEMVLLQADVDVALEGFRRAAEDFPQDEWGVRSAFRFAEVKYARNPGAVDEEVETFIHQALDNLYFFQIRQDARVWYIEILNETGRYGEAIQYAHELLSRSIKGEGKRRVLDMMAYAFKNFTKERYKKKDFTEVCKVVSAESAYLFNERMTRPTFNRVVESFDQNLLYDSLYLIATSPWVKDLFTDRAQLALARAQAGRGQANEAKVIFESLMSDQKSWVGRKAALHYVRLLAREENDQRLIETTDLALAMPHTSLDRAELLILRSRARAHLGDIVTSAEGFRQALDLLMPAQSERERTLLADALFGLGMALYQAGRGPQAKPVLEAAVGAFPEDVRVGPSKIYLTGIGTEMEIPLVRDAFWEDMVGKMKRITEWKNANSPRLERKKG